METQVACYWICKPSSFFIPFFEESLLSRGGKLMGMVTCNMRQMGKGDETVLIPRLNFSIPINYLLPLFQYAQQQQPGTSPPTPPLSLDKFSNYVFPLKNKKKRFQVVGTDSLSSWLRESMEVESPTRRRQRRTTGISKVHEYPKEGHGPGPLFSPQEPKPTTQRKVVEREDFYFLFIAYAQIKECWCVSVFLYLLC